MLELEFIVTGTGRCGTLFVANFLTSAGFPCTHEAVFNLGGLDFALSVILGENKATSSKVSKGDNLSDFEEEIVAESSYMSAPFLQEFPMPKVLHVIRNPIKVVSSFIKFGYFSQPYPSESEENPENILYEQFIYSHLPELTEEMPQIDRACLYWIAWNELIENSGRVEYAHRIENSSESISKFLGSEGTYCNKKCNSFGETVKWSPSQIQSPQIKRKLKDLSSKYGYVKSM